MSRRREPRARTMSGVTPSPTTNGSTRHGATTQHGSKPEPSCERSATSKARPRSTSAAVLGASPPRFAKPGAHIIGVDPESAMLDVARHRIVPLAAGDARALPVRDNAVDIAVAVTVLEFVADPAAAMAELARIVRPGGRILVGALNPHSAWGLAHHHEFTAPPWNAARFLTRHQLRELGARYGRVKLHGALSRAGRLSTPRAHRAGRRAGRPRTTGLGCLPDPRRRDTPTPRSSGHPNRHHLIGRQHGTGRTSSSEHDADSREDTGSPCASLPTTSPSDSTKKLRRTLKDKSR